MVTLIILRFNVLICKFIRNTLTNADYSFKHRESSQELYKQLYAEEQRRKAVKQAKALQSSSALHQPNYDNINEK